MTLPAAISAFNASTNTSSRAPNTLAFAGGDGYVDVFSPAKAKVFGALLEVFEDALKADMAAGKVTQLPVLDGRVKKVN